MLLADSVDEGDVLSSIAYSLQENPGIVPSGA